MKNKMMKKFIITLVLIFSVFTMQAQEKVNWVGFNEALKLNKLTPKPILVDIYTDWCGPCKQMEKLVYGNEVIAAYINKHYYAVKLDGEGKESVTYRGKNFTYDTYEDNNGRTLTYNQFAGAILNTGEKLGGKSVYPTTAFFDTNEELFQIVPGYVSEKRLEKILAYFKDGDYEDKSWDEFEKTFKSEL